MPPHPANPTIAESREKLDLTDAFLVAIVILLASGSVFTAGMNYGMDLAGDHAQAQVDSAIEDAQLQISDAIHEADKFRRSLECTAETPTECRRWEPRL